MIHFGKVGVTCKVADLPIAGFHLKKIQSAGGDQSFTNFDCGRFNFLVAPSVLVRRLTALCRREPFVSSWFGLKVDKTTCMPLEQMILLYETQP